jgi:peptidoglycan/LPS O-acetylase OafA/YrhL
MATVETALRQQGPWLDGVAPLRLGLVAAVFVYQSLEISGSYGRLINSPIWILPAILVPALFAIAGFLLSRSLDRGGVRAFLRRRVLRNWPMLAFGVLVTALGIGPIATTVSLASYFGDRELGLYLLNLVAIPVYRLPEVFTANNVESVNDLLWASPFVVLGTVILASASLRPRATVPIVAASLVVIAVAALAVQLLRIDIPSDLAALRAITAGRGLTALTCCLLGALAWQLRRRLPLHPLGTVAAALAIVAAAGLGRRNWAELAAFDILISVPVTYLVVSLSLARLPLAGVATALHRYFAGFLLFAYPVQQLVVASRLLGDSFPVVVVASLPGTALLAYIASQLVQRVPVTLTGGLRPPVGPAVLAGRPFSLAEIRRRSGAVAADFALWLAFFIVALAILAMTMFAFSPESGGI